VPRASSSWPRIRERIRISFDTGPGGRNPGFALAGGPVLLGLCLLLAAAGAWPARAADEVQLIRQFSDASGSDAREKICRQLLAEKPALYAQFFCIGFQAILAGDDAGAEKSLDDALAQQPDFSLAALLYGQTYEERNNYEQAEKMYRRAIAIQPAHTDARFALGSLQLHRGQSEDPKYLPQALETFRQMTEADPSSPDGWSSMALVLVSMGRLADAEAMCRKAVARAPKDPAVYDNLAAVLERENKDDEAVADWQKSLILSPQYGKSVIELASLYGRAGKLALAVRTLEEGHAAIEAPPWGPRIARDLGFAYLRLDQRRKARTRLSQAAWGGDDALAFAGLGHLRMMEDSVAVALPTFERALKLDSTLCIPFVRAWRDSLAGRTRVYPKLERTLGHLQNPDRKFAAGSPDAVPPPGVSGAAATNALVNYVLDGWSFRDLDQAVKDLNAVREDSTAQETYDVAPAPLTQVTADYPETMQEQGAAGTVDIRVTVDETGRVVEARVQSCNAPSALCLSALDAAEKWTFHPALKFGRPVKATVTIPFRFGTQP